MEVGRDHLAPNNNLDKSESASNESYNTRPNKFSGLNSTWRELTKEERLVDMFVTRMRDQNISIHLYNARAMKSRHFNFNEVSKESPRSNMDYLRREKTAQSGCYKEFTPQKSWTAWPLSPDFVPRPGEQAGNESGAEKWIRSRREFGEYSLELEEILIAFTLRLAKEMFQARGRTDQIAHECLSNNGTTIGDDESDDAGVSNSSERGREFQRETTEQDFPNGAREGAAEGPNIASEPENFTELPIKSHSQLDFLRPHVMVDDEQSVALLRPTIRHHLSQLDELLMALHEARKACLHYGSGESQSESENEDGKAIFLQKSKLGTSLPALDDMSNTDVIPHELTAKQQVGRQGIADILVTSTSNSHENKDGRSKSSRGRKRKLHEPLEGESQSEMLLRIARNQKKPIPFRTSVAVGSKTASPSTTFQKRPSKRGYPQHAGNLRSKRLGLRGWSEVLGAAALVGLSPEAIARTTQKCATLFGEGMAMISLADNSPLGKGVDQIIHYLPGQIPDRAATVHHRSGNEQCEIKRTSSERGVSRRHSKANSEDLAASEEFNALGARVDNFCCPWQNCTRHKQAFASKKYLTRHLQKAHKLQGSKLRSALNSGGAEMIGGVHIDGFLKEVVRRPGWRGTDGEPRQRSTTEEYLREQLKTGSDHGLLSSS